MTTHAVVMLRAKRIAQLREDGATTSDVSAALGLTERQIRHAERVGAAVGNRESTAVGVSAVHAGSEGASE